MAQSVEVRRVSLAEFKKRFPTEIKAADKRAASQGLPVFKDIERQDKKTKKQKKKKSKKLSRKQRQKAERKAEIQQDKLRRDALRDANITQQQTQQPVQQQVQEPLPEQQTQEEEQGTWGRALDEVGEKLEEFTSDKTNLLKITPLPAAKSIKVLLGLEEIGTKLIVSEGAAAPAVTKAASGGLTTFETLKQVKGVGTVLAKRLFLDNTLKAATNTKTASTTMKYLTKTVSHLKKPKTVIGVISTTIGLWGLGSWGQAEGIEGLAWQYDKAIDEDPKLAAEINETLEEALDIPLWESVLAITPVLQLPITAKRIWTKVLAARAQKKVSDVKFARANGDTYTPSQSTQTEREESEAYYMTIENKKKLAKTAGRKEEQKYYQDLLDDKEAAAKRQRKSDEAYWKGIREDNAQAKKDERDAEETYWAGVRAKNK